jgi:hypothetical protein
MNEKSEKPIKYGEDLNLFTYLNGHKFDITFKGKANSN